MRTKKKLQPRRKQHGLSTQASAQTHATNRLYTIVIQPHRHRLRLSGWANAHFGDEVVFDPPPYPKKCHVVPLLEPKAELAKKTQGDFGLLEPAQVPA